MVDRGADRNRISIRITVTSFSHIVYWCVGKFLRELPICVVCGVLGVVAMRRGRGVQTVTGLLSQVSLMPSIELTHHQSTLLVALVSSVARELSANLAVQGTPWCF